MRRLLLVVPLGVVSRRHCQVSRLGDRYVVADLGSANGTFVNDNEYATPLERPDAFAGRRREDDF